MLLQSIVNGQICDTLGLRELKILPSMIQDMLLPTIRLHRARRWRRLAMELRIKWWTEMARYFSRRAIRPCNPRNTRCTWDASHGRETPMVYLITSPRTSPRRTSKPKQVERSSESMMMSSLSLFVRNLRRSTPMPSQWLSWNKRMGNSRFKTIHLWQWLLGIQKEILYQTKTWTIRCSWWSGTQNLHRTTL